MNGMTLLILLALLALTFGIGWSMGRTHEAYRQIAHTAYCPGCPCSFCVQVEADFADVADTPDPYDWRCDPGAFGADVIELRRGERA